MIPRQARTQQEIVFAPLNPCDVGEELKLNALRLLTFLSLTQESPKCSDSMQLHHCAGTKDMFFSFCQMARLQSEFCTKDFFRATNSVTKNAPKFSPKFSSLCSVGQKKSRKIPSKFPTKFSKFPCEKSKKNHRRASAGAQGQRFFVSEKCRGGQDKAWQSLKAALSESHDIPRNLPDQKPAHQNQGGGNPLQEKKASEKSPTNIEG